jgi:hypothetical protein
MAGPKKRAPPSADPRRGKNPGYAETHPGDAGDAHQPVIPPQPTPDEAGIEHDPRRDGTR